MRWLWNAGAAMNTVYLPDDIEYLTDAAFITEYEYVLRQEAAIEALAPDNAEYVALVLARLEHLNSEAQRRLTLVRYKPYLNGRISVDKIEEIKERLPLDRVIGQFVRLRKAGANQVAHCPFHEDKTPSLTVYKDHYFCFGCQTGGDVFSWLMQMQQGATFMSAVRAAALMAGVELRPLPKSSVGDERALLT